MPIYHNNILCITPSEFEACGIKRKTIYSYVSKQEKGELYCWENHKEGKNTYIHYNGLKDKYKALVKLYLCNNIEPEVYLNDKEDKKKQQLIDNLTDQITTLVKSDHEE